MSAFKDKEAVPIQSGFYRASTRPTRAMKTASKASTGAGLMLGW